MQKPALPEGRADLCLDGLDGWCRSLLRSTHEGAPVKALVEILPGDRRIQIHAVIVSPAICIMDGCEVVVILLVLLVQPLVGCLEYGVHFAPSALVGEDFYII